MRELWHRLAYHFHEGGITQIIRQVSNRLRFMASGREEWLIYSLPAPQDPASDPQSLRRETLGFQDLQHLNYYKALAFPDGIMRRLNAGATCHGFFVGDGLANIAWTQPRVLELSPGLELDIGRGVSIYDCVTLPAHRGKGIYPSSLRILGHQCASSGDGTVFIAVDPGNLASIKGIVRAGFVFSGKVTRLIKFGRSRVLIVGDQLRRSDQ